MILDIMLGKAVCLEISAVKLLIGFLEVFDHPVELFHLFVQVGADKLVFLLRDLAVFPVGVEVCGGFEAFFLLFLLRFERAAEIIGFLLAAVLFCLGDHLVVLQRDIDHRLKIGQDCLLQSVDSDGVVGAGGGAFLLLGRAFIVAVGLSVLPVDLFVHGFSAVGAIDESGEQIRFSVGFTAVDISAEQRLRLVKGFAVDDRLVGAFHDDPLVLRHRPTFVDLVIDRAVHALHHIADVHLILQDAAHRPVAPQTVVVSARGEMKALLLLVQGRIRYAHAVELLYNADHTVAADEFVKNQPHHGSGFLVDHQPVAVVRVFQIAVRGKSADELALLAVVIERAADIHRGGRGVALVDDVGDADGNAARGGVHAVACGVDAVIERDEPHAETGELIIDQVAARGVVPAETRQVLDDNAVDFPAADIVHQPCPVGAVKIRARKAVVHVGIDVLDIGVEPQILLQDLALIGDRRALGLVFVHILFGQSNVQGSLPGLESLLGLTVIVFILLHEK